MKVDVTYIGAELAWSNKPHEGVQVRAVHVYLPAVRVDNLTCFADSLFKHAVCRGIGDHECRESIAVLCRFFLKIR